MSLLFLMVVATTQSFMKMDVPSLKWVNVPALSVLNQKVRLILSISTQVIVAYRVKLMMYIQGNPNLHDSYGVSHWAFQYNRALRKVPLCGDQTRSLVPL